MVRKFYNERCIITYFKILLSLQINRSAPRARLGANVFAGEYTVSVDALSLNSSIETVRANLLENNLDAPVDSIMEMLNHFLSKCCKFNAAFYK